MQAYQGIFRAGVAVAGPLSAAINRLHAAWPQARAGLNARRLAAKASEVVNCRLALVKVGW